MLLIQETVSGKRKARRYVIDSTKADRLGMHLCGLKKVWGLC